MTTPFVAAAVQMNSGEDKEANVQRASRLVEQAANAGARLVALPEMFNCLGRFRTIVQQAETIPGPTSDAMSQLAERLNIHLLAGSICEVGPDATKGFNTSLMFAPSGQIIGEYRKIHLFDVDLPDRVTIQESDWICPGDALTVIDTDCARLGISICYDLRFPELYRRLADQQAELLFVPAAFTHATGRDHWQVLLRARAIENQAFVMAPNQCGEHPDGLTTYGHSLIVDPWGTVLADAGETEGIAVAAIDRQHLQHIREQLPALQHRRPLPRAETNRSY